MGESSLYDALGRLAEVGKTGGVYTELLYGLDGAKLAAMNGQTLGRGLVGLRGG